MENALPPRAITKPGHRKTNSNLIFKTRRISIIMKRSLVETALGAVVILVAVTFLTAEEPDGQVGCSGVDVHLAGRGQAAQ